MKENDVCFYIMEYHSKLGYKHSNENSTIQNLKKPMDRINNSEWSHKEKAIREIGEMCKQCFDKIDSQRLIIPIPPSKTKNDILYDNRILQILNIARQDNGNIIHNDNIILQSKNYPASHENDGNRMSADALEKIYEVDLNELVSANIKNIIIFDDVITTGAHFRAVCNKLEQGLGDKFHEYDIKGLFVARTIRLEPEES